MKARLTKLLRNDKTYGPDWTGTKQSPFIVKGMRVVEKKKYYGDIGHFRNLRMYKSGYNQNKWWYSAVTIEEMLTYVHGKQHVLRY